MRSIRKLALLAIAALMVCAAVASAASAVTVSDASTGVALTTGNQVNGVSTNSKLTGSFFGVSTTVTCTQSAFIGTTTTNPTGDLTSLAWSGCKNAGGTACNVSTLNTAWSNAMTFTTATNLQVTVPSNGGVQISGTGCLPLSATCTFGAGQTINFAWSNATSTATVSATVTSPTCGNGSWTGAYRGRTGNTIGSGNDLSVA